MTRYLPEMAGTAYADATLRDVMDMRIGVQYSEDYTDPNAEVRAYGRAGGMSPRGPNYTGPNSFYDFLRTLRKQGEHGAGFSYKTVNTEVLAWAKINKGFKVGITKLGDEDTIAPAVQKGNKELLNWINDEIVKLGKENFFHKDYEETLKPVYGSDVNPDDIVVEGGKL